MSRQDEPRLEDRLMNDSDEQRGLYLYGIGRSTETEHDAGESLDPDSEIFVIESGGLIAFVRRVDLSDYSEEAIRSRLEDQEWLISVAREHHQNVARIHEITPILPAKFGSIYGSEEAVRDALASAPAKVAERLDVIDGCDEWAIHVFRDAGSIADQVLAEDPSLRELSEQLEQASEGRAYLLRQQIQSRLREAIERYELSVAREVLAGVRQWTREIQIEPPKDSPVGEREVARASVLVRRSDTEPFLAAVAEAEEATPGVRLEITGPWPAYSFAQLEDEDLVYG